MRSQLAYWLAATAGSLVSAGPCPGCKATANWPGWSKIQYAFIFGDSYTQTGFNTSLTAPSPSNPLGNPPYPGWTSSNGPNWVDFLTVKHNASLLQTYNLAYGGATVSSDLVTPYAPHVLSLADQVRKLFPFYHPATSPPWTGSNSIFGIWIGINDIGNSFWKGPEVSGPLNLEIVALYKALVGELYDAGARNFVFLNVPPVERSPLTLGQGQATVDLEKADIAEFNGLVAQMAAEIKAEREGVNAWLYDTYEVFGEVLDDPASYPQTAQYKNVTAYCEAYQNGTPQWDTFVESCGIPVDEYFWLNSLHPTYPVHDVVAEGVADALAKGPNVCA